MIRPRGVIVAVLAEVLLTAGIARLIGTPVVWSALIALPMSLVLMLLLTTPSGVEPTWTSPPHPPSAAAHLDASTLASRLDDAVADQGRFRARIQPRLAALALGKLRCRGELADVSDLADPRAAAALGGELHRLLTDPRAIMPDPKTLRAMLDRLEEQ